MTGIPRETEAAEFDTILQAGSNGNSEPNRPMIRKENQERCYRTEDEESSATRKGNQGISGAQGSRFWSQHESSVEKIGHGSSAHAQEIWGVPGTKF